jgi:hypothetical protein
MPRQVIAMRRLRFRAIITLASAQACPGTPLHPAVSGYLNHTHALMVRARKPHPPGHSRAFPAEICWDGEQPLHPGDRAVVTITVTDDEAAEFFGAGQRFTLWSGGDVGRGVVSRRVFTENAPS